MKKIARVKKTKTRVTNLQKTRSSPSKHHKHNIKYLKSNQSLEDAMPYLKRLTCLGLLFLTMSIFLVVTGVFLKIPIAEQVSNSDKTMGVTFLVLSCTAIVYGEKACNLLILKINQTINQLAGLPKDYAAHLYGTEPAEISIGHSHHHPPYT